MLPTLSEQTVYFLASIAFGAALSVLYGLIRLFRIANANKNAVTVVGDILFFFAAGVLTSLFSLPFNKGEVRGFILLGESVGFLLMHFTLGALFSRLSVTVIMSLRKIGRKIFKIVKKVFKKLLIFMHFILYNVGVVIDKILGKVSEKKQKSKVRIEKNERKRKKKKAAGSSGA